MSWLLAALPAALCGEDLYRYVFCRHWGVLMHRFLDKEGHESWYYAQKEAYKQNLRAIPCEKFAQTSVRGGTLRGFYYRSGEGYSRRIAFIVHGYRAEHTEAAGPVLDYYLSRGFDVFCCDHYAHGESDGEHIGYGAWESEDCLHWLDFLRWRFKDAKILLHGFSMGGGIVLKICDRVPESVKLIVSDSGFTGPDEILKNNLGVLYAPMALAYRLITKYPLSSANDRQSVQNARVPLLFVHGEDDKTVPFSMGRELYELCRGEKDCLFLPGVRHVETAYLHKKEYSALLDGAIERHMK